LQNTWKKEKIVLPLGDINRQKNYGETEPLELRNQPVKYPRLAICSQNGRIEPYLIKAITELS